MGIHGTLSSMSGSVALPGRNAANKSRILLCYELTSVTCTPKYRVIPSTVTAARLAVDADTNAETNEPDSPERVTSTSRCHTETMGPATAILVQPHMRSWTCFPVLGGGWHARGLSGQWQ
jgi:hypothetical protein